MKRLLALLVLVCALGALSTSCAGWKVPCTTIAKAGCQLVGLIPTVGTTAESLCDAFAGGSLVNDFCAKTAQPKIDDFFALVGDWLGRHGLSTIVQAKAPALLTKQKNIATPAIAPLAPAK